MIKKVSFYLMGYLFTLMMFSSCNYDYIYPEPIPIRDFSFKTDIIPMFNKSCNATCHAKGATPPDLSAANAYASIMAIPNLINITTPKESIFYVKLSTGSMKDLGMTDADKTIFLKWIEQGAKDN